MDQWHAPLPQAITGSKPATAGFSEGFVTSLLHSSKRASAIFDSKVRSKIVALDNPEADRSKKDERKLVKKTRKLNKKRCNRKERREAGFFTIPQDLRRYEYYLPLNSLWNSYIDGLIDDSAPSDCMLSQLIKADFHGAIIRVYRAKCPGNVGITGIVAKDTENTFNIITIDNQLKVIPKQGHEFVFTAKGKSVILFGNQFRHRPADRINKKMNANGSLEL